MVARTTSWSRSPQRTDAGNKPWLDPKKQLHPGCKVSLQGLHVQRNGQIGVIVSFIERTSKWRVRLTTGQEKDLKAEHLRVEAAAASPRRHIATEVKTHPRSPAETKQAVAATSQEAQRFQPGHPVRLCGLKSAVDLNGQFGILETLVEATGRWRVKLESGQVKDLKTENLQHDLKAVAMRKQVDALDAELAAKKLSPGQQGIVSEVVAGETCGPGERFVIQEKLGEGTFSTVFRCTDTQTPGIEFAIKFTRASEHTRKALKREVQLMTHFCTHISRKDPEGSSCLLNLAFFESLEHKGLLAVATELMKCNLKAALQKYGAGGGLPLLPTVRNFGRNIFSALRALRQANLIHCDVKPENLLLSMDNESVKLCDFGSTLCPGERPRTDEMQPRHYRAPEVILGQGYTTQIDMWSAGATIYQLSTGLVLFPGETNNAMLFEMLKVCGPFPPHLPVSGAYAMNHFHANSDFLNAKGDVALNPGNPSVIPMSRFNPPSRTLDALLSPLFREAPKGVPLSRHQGLVGHLIELLRSCLMPDPTQRATPGAALAYSLFQKGA